MSPGTSLSSAARPEESVAVSDPHSEVAWKITELHLSRKEFSCLNLPNETKLNTFQVHNDMSSFGQSEMKSLNQQTAVHTRKTYG